MSDRTLRWTLLPALLGAFALLLWVGARYDPADPPPERTVTATPAATEQWTFLWGDGSRHNAAVGSTVTIHVKPVPADLQGLTCDLAGTANATESVHPGNVLHVRSNGDTFDAVDVEAAPWQELSFGGSATLGEVIVFEVELGDGDESPNLQTTSVFGVADLVCALPPETTIPPPTVPPTTAPQADEPTTTVPGDDSSTSTVPPTTEGPGPYPDTPGPDIDYGHDCRPVNGAPDQIDVWVTIDGDLEGRTYYIEFDGGVYGFGAYPSLVGRWERTFDARRPGTDVALRVWSFNGTRPDEEPLLEMDARVPMDPCSDEEREEYEPPSSTTPTTTTPPSGPNRDLYQGTESG